MAAGYFPAAFLRLWFQVDRHKAARCPLKQRNETRRSNAIRRLVELGLKAKGGVVTGVRGP